METNSEVKEYTTTNDNIKYGTYHMGTFDEDIKGKIDLNVLNTDIDSLISTISNFNTLYVSLITSNVNDVNTVALSLNRKTIFYFLVTKFYERLVKAVKEVFGENQTISTEEQYNVSTMIETFIKEAKLDNVFNEQYPEDKAELVERISVIYNHEQEVKKATRKGGIILCDVSIKYCICYFKKVIEKINLFKAITNFSQYDYEQMIVLFNLLLHLENIESFDLILFNSFYYVDPSDITNLDENTEEWTAIKKNWVRIVPNSPEVIIQAGKDITKKLSIVGAILSNGFTSSSNFSNYLSAGWMLVNFKFSPTKSLFEAKKNDLVGNRPETMIKMRNFMKIGLLKKLSMRSYPEIAFRKKLYLRRDEKEITVDYIKELVAMLKSGKFEVDEDMNSKATILKYKEIMSKKRKELCAPDNIYVESLHHDNKHLFTSTRLIHSSTITFANDRSCIFCSSNTPNNTKDSLIIHIHGGGFIGTSTVVHEKYLRTWVNQLDIPLIGIDYSLSPHNKYPKALDDIWQGYNWIINHAEDQFKISPKKIVLSGDSAGGNLIFALVFLLIVHKKRIPDLILAEYPCCDVSLYNMSPSIMLALHEDIMLNMSFLKFCNEAYRNTYHDDEDPFLNPIKAPDELIKQMPQTFFFIGSSDPLRDGAIRMMHKMTQQGVPYKTFEFKDFIHGFYGMETLRKIPNEILIKEVREFLDNLVVKKTPEKKETKANGENSIANRLLSNFNNVI